MKLALSRFSKYASVLFVFIVSFSFVHFSGESSLLRSSVVEAKTSQQAIVFSRNHPQIRAAIQVKNRHIEDLMATVGVEGVGIGFSHGHPVIKVFTTGVGIHGIPESLDGLPVEVKVTGRIVALQDPVGPTTRFDRPVPIGVSTGHPNITAGTIGCRVVDSYGNVYALSNNHVYADENDAAINDNVLQPGVYDGGTDPADAIGTLFDFEPIGFCRILKHQYM